MSLVIDDTGQPVHYPKRRDVFEFDAEVASIFENMALRSIPAYAETHRVHASIAKMYIEDKFTDVDYPVYIADIGASTGVFFKTLCAEYNVDPEHGLMIQGISCVAYDNSSAMLDKLHDAMPWVPCVLSDVTEFNTHHQKFDIINVSYLIQFLPQGTRFRFLKSVAEALNPGGLLFVSQKESIANSDFDRYFTTEYIKFRMDNGYSVDEILSKTEALKNSMWVDTYSFMNDMLLGSGFVYVQPTTRWLNFSSLVCVRNEDGRSR